MEQDLALSRALVEVFQQPGLARALAFRGGTALNKLVLDPAVRYSEDIDLVQLQSGPIGPLLDQFRACLEPWLGEPKRMLSEGRATLIYRFHTEEAPHLPLRLKVEINTREHFTVRDIDLRAFSVDSPWFSGKAEIPTYDLEEMLGTKLRALFQRKKGRDLFDLWWVGRNIHVDTEGVVECFRRYLKHEGRIVSRAEFEANFSAKMKDPSFASDIEPLLAAGVQWDRDAAADYVRTEFLARIPGEPWKGPNGTPQNHVRRVP